MLSNKVVAPFVLAAIGCLYMSWKGFTVWIPWLAVFTVISAGIYVMSPQIDWWWAKRNPPNLAPKLVELLQRFSPFYNRLDERAQKRFQHRIGMFTMGTDWTAQGWDDVPLDVRTVFASYGVQLTFHQEDFLFEKFEKIIVYPHPFPSPMHPVFHNSELFEPDGCMLFSAPETMQGYFEPQSYYQIGLHEYAKAYTLSYPEKKWPKVGPEYWQKLEAISGFNQEATQIRVGLEIADVLPVAIHHYFIFREKFMNELPELGEQLDEIFS